MNKCTTILAAATFAAATFTASAANNCAVVGDPTDNTKGAALHTTWYGQCLTNSFSFGVWVKGMKNKYACYPFYSQNVSLWCQSSENTLRFRVAQSNLSEGTTEVVTATLANGRRTLEETAWHFYCCTFNYDPNNSANSFQRLYIDGELKAEVSGASIVGPAVAPVSGNHVTIGGNWSTGGYANNSMYAGSVAEITVWSRALSPTEVATLKTRRAGGFENGLEVYWPLAGSSVAEPNRVSGGATAPLAVHRDNYGTIAMAEDPDFPLDNARCVASAEWIAQHSYVQSADATFRSWDDPATNIATAFAAAIPGETILLMPGTHPIFEQIDITKANLTVAKKPDAEGEAVIDAQGLCRHFSSSSDASGADGFVFDGLTFVNGSATSGGAMYFKGKVGTIRDCVFRDNAATNGSGGAIHSYTANGTVISNCVFASNSAGANGGAIYTQQNSENANDRCIVANCVITNNTAATRSGGGIAAERCIEIDGCRFADNKATGENYRGGDIYAGIYSQIKGCAFAGGSSASYGRSIEIVGDSATISGCDFGGAMPGNGYGVIHTISSNCLISDCVFTNLSWSTAQLIFPEGASASVTVRQCLIGENAGSGFVIADFSGKSRFENCTILTGAFDSKFSSRSCQNVLVNCIVPNADITSSGSFVNILTNCLVKSVSGGTSDSGVMTCSPKFADAANGDYRLASTSSCREKGLVLDWMAAGSTDLAGEPRLVNLLGKAYAADARPDLGCYECQEVGIQPTVVTFR
ncbi:MAG: right-handed parallel beta-helix repeat-containing protein [Kiritimatiellae bacterium]|nr:right-handed parallel beta-helix repeat-containing protein [Kiritimatiellia bacterium]